MMRTDYNDGRAPFRGLVKRTEERGREETERILSELPTPCYLIDEAALRKNGEILKGVQDRTGCRILLAQKAFSNYDTYPILSEYLAGTEASGLYEAKLGAERMPDKEVHTFCGAFRAQDMPEVIAVSDHIVFNSPGQLKKFGPMAKAAGKSVGLRVNPEFSTQEGHEIYDPCAPGSRLGTTRAQWEEEMTGELIGLLDGLHFHTLCEQNSDDLERTLPAVEEKFGEFLPRMTWLNFGGGHHITRPDYDLETLERCICRMRDTYDLQIYLEPGEACALNAGYLLSQVLDVRKNGEIRLAILDSSAACHMPDVLEMPYLPPLMGALPGENAGEKDPEVFSETGLDPEEYRVKYRLGGPTCLSGDVIGEYGFDGELKEGDTLIFGDMAIYTTCKNNTFNGMPLPDIYSWKEDGSIERLTSFGYEDFRMRLGKA